MKEIYYDPKHVLSNVDDLSRKTGYSKKTVEEWLGKQNVYTLLKPIKHKIQNKKRFSLKK